MTNARALETTAPASLARGITLAQLWAFLAVGLPVLAGLLANLSSVDLAYHLRAGAIVLDTGRIPATDTFTFTAAGLPWQDQQWGAQALLAATQRAFGWPGLALLRAGLVGAIFGFLFLAIRRRDVDVRRAAWLTIAAFSVTAVALALRPQLFGMVLLAATLWLVAGRRSHPRAVWAIPVLVLVWANVHGSFFLGPVVLGLAWLEDVYDRASDRHLLLRVALVSVAASLVNPLGVSVWAYAAGLSTNSVVTSRITEWQPTTLRTIPGILFFGSVAVVVVILARRGRRTSWPAVAWFGFFAAIGAYAIRGVAWWPLGAAFALAPLLAPEPIVSTTDATTAERPPRRDQRRVLNLVVVVVLVLAGIALLPFWRPVDARTGAPQELIGDAPPGITAALASSSRPGDHVLNPQPWGSWFEYALPDRLYALDSRIEVFPAQTWLDYDTIESGRAGWQQILASWNVQIIVADKDSTAFVARLVAAGWRASYSDADGTILLSQ